jgi:hypothetical protein
VHAVLALKQQHRRFDVIETDAGITAHELCISKTSVYTCECIPTDYYNDKNLSMDAYL